MINLMLFEEFSLNPKNNVLTKILDKIQPDINSLLEEYKKYYEKQLEKTMTKYDEELSRLIIVSDLVKSIGNHTNPDDDLKEVKTSVSPKGNLEIDAIIVRDGVEYPLSTEVIYAGGYNIQRLHYRYITKTRLPKSSSNELADQYKKKIKAMTSAEKIRNEIQGFEARINRNDERVESSKKLSDGEILDSIMQQDSYFSWPTWDEIVARGADKNYEYSEDVYNKSKEEERERKINFWKSQNIEGPEKNSVDLKKEIEKLKKKLAAIEQ